MCLSFIQYRSIEVGNGAQFAKKIIYSYTIFRFKDPTLFCPSHLRWIHQNFIEDKFYVGWMRGALLGRILHYKVKVALKYSLYNASKSSISTCVLQWVGG